MQRCSHCNAQQLDGTIFCAECGASMVGGGGSRETTAALNKAAAGAEALQSEPARIRPAPAPAAGLPTIALVVISSGRRITLETSAELIVGRKDNQRGIYPDIDLGLDGGFDAGVSRRHARILCASASYQLEDLASANGTFINGERLAAQAPTAIRHGDEIQFGTLILRFEIG